MYSSKLQRSLLQTNPKLSNVILEASLGPQFYQYSFYFKKFSTIDTLQSFHSKLRMFIKNERLLNIFKDSVFSIPKNLKNQSSKILRVWTHQCECVLAQKIRRSQQMFTLYSKIWEETALKEFLRKMRQQMVRQSKEFIIGAVGVAIAWDNVRINETDMLQHVSELEYIKKLRENTVVCTDCSDRNMTLCTCTEQPPETLSYDNWSIFISKDDLLVWRRPNPAGYFEYKVYGVYNDVSAEDFLNVQVDIEYRRVWDKTAVKLEIIESDPDATKHGDIIYWELLWPRLFSNRDYVFKRRFIVDYNSKSVILMNQSMDVKGYEKSDKVRVKDYWSYMVIKPSTADFKKPGIEFSLTYYDNPGVNIPTPVMTWVSMRAMPDFLANLREATKKYREFCKDTNHNCVCSIFSKEPCDTKTKSSSDDCKDGSCKGGGFGSAPGAELMAAPSPMMQHDSTASYWKYIQSTFSVS